MPPSSLHEAFVQLFRHQPEPAAEMPACSESRCPALPDAARRNLEVMMPTETYEQSEEDEIQRLVDRLVSFTKQKRAEVDARVDAELKAEGAARAVLAVPTARGIHVAEDTRSRISECTDLDQLDTWIRRAATATTIDDLFG